MEGSCRRSKTLGLTSRMSERPALNVPCCCSVGPRKPLESDFNPAPGNDTIRRPGAARQAERLRGKWETLQRAMQERSTEITGELAGTDPELVLVIEIIGDRWSIH